MKPALEAPRPGYDVASLVAYLRKDDVFEWNWHYHPEIELTWICKGRGTRLVGDHSSGYGPDDLVLLGPNLPHTWFSSTRARGKRGNEAVVIQFRAFPEAMYGVPEFEAIGQLLARAGRGLVFPGEVVRGLGERLIALPRLTGLERWLSLAGILGTLAGAPAESLASAGYRHRRSSGLGSRLERVLAHIERHHAEELSLAQAARVAGLTPSAFSRFFRKLTRKSFVDYRNGRRITEACRLLVNTDHSIAEIAYQCGFGNLANFNRRFLREKQMAPREYRRLHSPVFQQAAN